MTQNLTSNQQLALSLVQQLLEIVRECGADGCPSGVLYGALMEFGCDLDTYQTFESILIDSGAVRKARDCLFAVPGFGGLTV